MNEQKNNGRGIFYGVIGVATLVVAIIGATFAYFTASATNSNAITGNMASISLGLGVRKVTTADDTKGGMIPMSNSMVEAAVSKNDVCVDDNGNAVCQVYEITLTNDSTVGQFVDGYVALKGGSGEPTDLPEGVEYLESAKFDASGVAATNGYGTTMRWAQVFPTGTGEITESTKYTTAATTGTTAFKLEEGATEITWESLDAKTATDATGFNKENIKSDGVTDDKYVMFGNEYKVINTNYIRISNHAWTTEETNVIAGNFDRTADITSALVFNQNVPAKTDVETDTSNVKKYYFVVWLSETGTNQTAGQKTGEGAEATNVTPDAMKFFSGNVTFVSAQGSEVSATFGGYSRVTAQP